MAKNLAPFLVLKHKGDRISVSKQEAIDLAQKGYDYTQKTQRLAAFRKDLAEQLTSMHNAYKTKCLESAHLWRRIAALKGAITRMKRK